MTVYDYEAPFSDSDYRIGDDGSFRWDRFEAEVVYEVEGTYYRVADDASKIGHRADHSCAEWEGTFRQTEPIEANIINVDAWFDPDYFYDSPNPIEVDDDLRFHTDYLEAEITFNVPWREIIAAALQRGLEDKRHPAYILGGWAKQATDANDVNGRDFVSAFEHRETLFDDLPGDETMTDYRGGYTR